MAIYMKYGDIKGDVTQSDHKEWLDIGSFQFGVGRAIMTPVGSTANRESSTASVSEVTVTKQMDASGPKFFLEACIGAKGKEVKFDFVQTGDPGATYLTITLSDALVSGYSVSSGGDRPSESISINFTKVEVKYVGTKTDTGAAPPIVVGYNLATAKSS